MFLNPFPDRTLQSVNSHEMVSHDLWYRPRLKPLHGSSPRVDSSDDTVGNDLSAAARKDVSYASGHRVQPIMLEPAFLDALDQLLDKFNNQPIPSSDDHHRAHGGHSHKTSSRRPGERTRNGQSTVQSSVQSGSGGGGKDSKSRGTDGESPPDGFRYPPSGTFQLPKFFGCPFYITDPNQFHECSNCRLRRLSDVSQHIARCHLLEQVELRTPRGEAASRNGADKGKSEKGTCTDPNLIKIYDPTCRQEFHGPTAEAKFSRHGAGRRCELKTIEDTGMLLPTEFTTLLEERDRAAGSVAKWYAMWRVCFPIKGFRTVPLSPYIRTIVPRERGEPVVREALQQTLIPIEHHNLIVNHIAEGLYPVDFIDSDVLQAVRYHQGKEDEVGLDFLSTQNLNSW
ncbi:uncharacterized protein FPRN_11170 [Fusarium proliferatum]|nr:uncharacterized protein FPRN_11170 [Fusarium proliferatum]